MPRVIILIGRYHWLVSGKDVGMTTFETSAARSGLQWDADTAPPLNYLVVPGGTREWRSSWADGLVETDLGFSEASDGNFAASHLRADGRTGSGEVWPGVNEDLCFLLVTEG